ncbi:MAG: DUF6265 family protein [Bacteroidota bacterium]
MKNLFLILLSGVLFIFPSFGQEVLTTNTLSGEGIHAKADLSAISWMKGQWKGNAFGGEVEEVWSAPMGDAMMGSFRLLKEGEISFYEFMLFREVENTLIFQVKHFNKDLTGWEEKNETEDFSLVKVDGNRVYFNTITFEKKGENELAIYLAMKTKDGHQEFSFVYERVGELE